MKYVRAKICRNCRQPLGGIDITLDICCPLCGHHKPLGPGMWPDVDWEFGVGRWVWSWQRFRRVWVARDEPTPDVEGKV